MRPTSCHPLSPYLAPPTPPGLWEGWRGRVQGASCAHPLGSCKQRSWWGQGAGQRLGSPASALQLGDLSASHRGPGLGVPSAPARTDSFYQLPGQARGPSAHTVLRAWHTVPTTDRDDLRFLEEKVEVAGGQGSQWGI